MEPGAADAQRRASQSCSPNYKHTTSETSTADYAHLRRAGAGGLGRTICSGVGGSKAVVGAYESAEGKVGEEQGKVRHRSAGRSGTEPKKA